MCLPLISSFFRLLFLAFSNSFTYCVLLWCLHISLCFAFSYPQISCVSFWFPHYFGYCFLFWFLILPLTICCFELSHSSQLSCHTEKCISSFVTPKLKYLDRMQNTNFVFLIFIVLVFMIPNNGLLLFHLIYFASLLL